MPVYNIGTTASLLISSVNRPISFSLHADADNTDTVNISTDDPTVTGVPEELQPGQTQSYSRWRGTIWAKAEAGTQNIGITSVSYDDEEILKS